MLVSRLRCLRQEILRYLASSSSFNRICCLETVAKSESSMMTSKTVLDHQCFAGRDPVVEGAAIAIIKESSSSHPCLAGESGFVHLRVQECRRNAT